MDYLHIGHPLHFNKLKSTRSRKKGATSNNFFLFNYGLFALQQVEINQNSEKGCYMQKVFFCVCLKKINSGLFA